MKKKVIQNLRSLTDKGHSTDTRVKASSKLFTIITELIEATECLSGIRPAVGIYGSARSKPNTKYYKLAKDIARKLSDEGFSIISGGGSGIMEAANKGAHEGKALSIGLNVKLTNEQSSNQYQDIALCFHHFFTRKITFARNSDAVIVMPGGFGTLDELSEILTLIQIKKSPPIPIILVGKTFWKGLFNWFQDELLVMKFISLQDIELIQILDEADEVRDAIMQFYKSKNLRKKKSKNRIPDDSEEMFYL